MTAIEYVNGKHGKKIVSCTGDVWQSRSELASDALSTFAVNAYAHITEARNCLRLACLLLPAWQIAYRARRQKVIEGQHSNHG